MIDQDWEIAFREMFRMAWADGSLSPVEVVHLQRIVAGSRASESVRSSVAAWYEAAPDVGSGEFAFSSTEARSNVVRWLFEIALADDQLALAEYRVLLEMKERLELPDEEFEWHYRKLMRGQEGGA